MKASSIATIMVLAALSHAAPHVRRDGELGHHVARYGYAGADSSAGGYYPTGGAWPTGAPSSTGGLSPSSTSGDGGSSFPTGTGVASSYGASPTGNARCPVDGAVVCNGPKYFGLCNFGSVVWQAVSDGMACVDGKVVGTGIYAIPSPWPPAPAGTR